MILVKIKYGIKENVWILPPVHLELFICMEIKNYLKANPSNKVMNNI